MRGFWRGGKGADRGTGRFERSAYSGSSGGSSRPAKGAGSVGRVTGPHQWEEEGRKKVSAGALWTGGTGGSPGWSRRHRIKLERSAKVREARGRPNAVHQE